MKIGLEAELKVHGRLPGIGVSLDTNKLKAAVEFEFEKNFLAIKKVKLDHKKGLSVSFSIGEAWPFEHADFFGKTELEFSSNPINPITIKFIPREFNIKDWVFLDHRWDGKLKVLVSIVIAPNLAWLAEKGRCGARLYYR